MIGRRAFLKLLGVGTAGAALAPSFPRLCGNILGEFGSYLLTLDVPDGSLVVLVDPEGIINERVLTAVSPWEVWTPQDRSKNVPWVGGSSIQAHIQAPSLARMAKRDGKTKLVFLHNQPFTSVVWRYLATVRFEAVGVEAVRMTKHRTEPLGGLYSLRG